MVAAKKKQDAGAKSKKPAPEAHTPKKRASPKEEVEVKSHLKGNKKPRTEGDSAKGSQGSKGKGEAVGVSAIADIPEISQATREVLAERGITSLFEIQQKAFPPAYRGQDVVGRAKTGCGKTLAFVIPSVERIVANKLTASKGSRKLPVCVAIAPTRELARQIFTDFETVGAANGLKAVCFYGGTAFGPQCDDLRSGVDLMVGTPGRLLDHINRQTCDLSKCRILVLDEADEMLSMGFQEDIEAIMEALPKENLQKVLFSATLPKWVNALVEKHLKDPVWIDVVRGEDSNATNSKITHKCVSCPPMMRGDCIGDLCKVHAGFFGKTIIFTDTKKECDELAAHEKLAAIGAAALHGDIGQNQREQVMDGFRSGRIKCLVATDVAARGLDVPNVDLVVQTHPPQDLDMYVHRAGRTARGGREGTSVTFYSAREEYIIRLLEHKKGIKMQRVGPPQPVDVVRAATADVVKQLDHVHQDSVDAFMDRAKELIEERGAEVCLAAALAALTGHTRQLKGRSILSAFEGCTALILESEKGIGTSSKGWYLLRQMLPEETVAACRGVTLCKTGNQVIFDAPDAKVPQILEAELWRGCKIFRATTLPELQEKDTDLHSAAQQLKDHRQQKWQRIQEKKSGSRGDSAKGRGRGGDSSGGRGGRGGAPGKGSGKSFGRGHRG